MDARYPCPAACGFNPTTRLVMLLHLAVREDCQHKAGRRADEDRSAFMIRYMDQTTERSHA